MTKADPLPWLLEPDNPSARYLTLTGLQERPARDPEVRAARAAIPGWGPAKGMLDAQWPEGYWIGPGVGYSPKYKATVWQIIFLAALGAPCTPAIERACTCVLEQSRLPDGRFSASKTAGGTVVCLNGNLLRALFQLGYEDPRREESLEALARMALQDGFRCRYNAPQKPRPSRMQDGLPCAWGAVKALGAFAEVPAGQRSTAVQAAIEEGITFLLDADLVKADYPTATKPSPLWRKSGFPLGYTSDLLEALDVLGRLGAGSAAQLDPAREFVLGKQDNAGRWTLEYTPHNTWASFGEMQQPNKWVTVRALRALGY